jgi:hypothetical protein
VRSFVIGSGMLAFYGAFGATLIILISLYCNKNSYPLNAYLLAAFTFFESWLVGTICAMYQQQGLECAAQVLKSTLYSDVDLLLYMKWRPCASTVYISGRNRGYYRHTPSRLQRHCRRTRALNFHNFHNF